MTNKLTQPTQIDDLLLYRLRRLVATGGATVIRMCEGQLGITWREWRVMASLRPGCVAAVVGIGCARTIGQGQNLTCNHQFGEQKIGAETTCTA